MKNSTIGTVRFLIAAWLVLLTGLVQASINLAIEANPDPAKPGETVNVVLTVTNTGALPVTGTSLQAVVPSGVSFIREEHITGGGDCPSTTCDVGETIVWTLGTLDPGAGVSVSMPPTIVSGGSAPTDGTLISFDAEVLVNAVQEVTASAEVEVQSAPILDLALDADKNPVAPGERVTYTMTYGNRGALSVSGAQLSFPIPAGSTLVSSTGGTQVGDEVQWTLNNLVAGQSAIQQVVVQADLSAIDGDLLVADAATLSGTANFVDYVARARSVTRLDTAASLTVTVEVNPDPAKPGETLNAEVTVTNRSTSAIFGTELQVRIPDGVDFIREEHLTGGGDCPSTTCDRHELVTWTLGTLPPGAGFTVSLPPGVTSGGNALANGELITLGAQVTGDGGWQALAGQSIVVDSTPSLDLALDEDVDPVAPEGLVTYTLTYGNRSALSVSGTQLSFPIPAGSTLVSSTGGTQVGDEVQWTLNNLVAGQSATQKVVVQANTSLVDGEVLLVNAATMSGTANFVDQSARARSVTRVATATPLTVSVEVNPDPAKPGETLNTEVTVTNRSASPVFGTQLLVRMPDGVDFIREEHLTGGGDCPSTTCDKRELVTWTLGTLPPGAGFTVSLPPGVTSGGNALANGELITLGAQVTVDGGLQALAGHSIVVENEPLLDLALDEDVDPVAPEGLVTYTLSYGNRSALSVSGTQLSFPIPAGSTLVSSTGGTQVGDEVQWTLNNLVAGQSATQKVVVQANTSLVDGEVLLVSAATMSGTANFVDQVARARSVTRVATAAPLTVSVEVNPDPAKPDELLNAEVTVTNRSASPVFGAELQVRMPDGVDFIRKENLTAGGDCPSTTCDKRELVTWTLGTLPPGGGFTVSLAPEVTSGGNALGNGELITLGALVTGDGSLQALDRHSIVVDSSPSLDLALDEDVNPVASGEQVIYTLTYGNRSALSVSGAQLSFPIPAGSTLVSSTGGTQVGNEVQWALNTLVAGEGGRRQVSVSVDSANTGDLLRVNAAQLSGSDSSLRYARATSVTRVFDSSVLNLSILVGPDPAQPDDTLLTELTVTNTSLSPIFGAELQARVPDDVDFIRESDLTGADCPSSTCDKGELITWMLGTIPAGDSVTVSMPPVVTSGRNAPPNGSLINLLSLVTEGSGTQATGTRSVLINPFVDDDDDDTADAYDNCLGLFNPGQEDSNGDGFGNHCDPDLNGDLKIDFADLAILKSVFFTDDADADLNVDGKVDFADLAIQKAMFFGVPGPSAMAP